LRRSLPLILAAASGLVVGAPTAVIASHRFADVPDSDPVHDAVESLTAAGVVRGCGSTAENYCPDRLVDREEMAQYISRSAVSLSQEVFSGELIDYAPMPVTTVQVTIPGRPGGRQQVRVDFNVRVSQPQHADCTTCGVGLWVQDAAGNQPVPSLSVTVGSGGVAQSYATITSVFTADAGSVQAYTLWGAGPYHPPYPDWAADQTTGVSGDAVAETAPLTN
jgi:hypothetical protein